MNDYLYTGLNTDGDATTTTTITTATTDAIKRQTPFLIFYEKQLIRK